MSVVYDDRAPIDATRLKDCIPQFRDHNINFGIRQILTIFRLTDVIDEHNNVLGPYKDLGLFAHQGIGIKNYGKRVNSYKTLFLTKKGIDFAIEHLQKIPNISLTKALREFLSKYDLSVKKKGDKH